MKIPQRGTAAADLFDQLEAYRANDLQWRGGRAFAYVYHAGAEAEAVAKEAYSRYLSVNGLDFTVFPSVRRLETEVAAMCASHLSAGPEAVGSFTSGGTESIMLAVKAARGAAKAKGGVPGTPEVILPVTAHAAFHKAAHYLGMKCVSIPVERATMQVNVADVAAAINENTVMLVGSATSYGPGVVDPIAELGELAQRHALWLHVDGCIGGFMIPYFRRLGAAIPDFDFRIPGVSSISMDLHKYGFAPKGASVVMYRTAEHRRHQMFAFSGWTGYTIVNHTVQSSKSGGPLAAAWAVMRFLGDEGYLAIAEKLWEATNAICDGIEAMDGIELLVRPQMCLIAACSTSVNI
ncbi:MAG: aspartate aminotransferase family protein, partial [Myxococcales bacterium]|nr:aspartate aminotransferase family protein [Myxococcales bacterium]